MLFSEQIGMLRQGEERMKGTGVSWESSGQAAAIEPVPPPATTWTAVIFPPCWHSTDDFICGKVLIAEILKTLCSRLEAVNYEKGVLPRRGEHAGGNENQGLKVWLWARERKTLSADQALPAHSRLCPYRAQGTNLVCSVAPKGLTVILIIQHLLNSLVC